MLRIGDLIFNHKIVKIDRTSYGIVYITDDGERYHENFLKNLHNGYVIP